MRVELSDIKDGCLKQRLIFASSDFPVLEEMDQHEEVSFVTPIDFTFRLQKTGQLVEVDGQLEAKVALTCGRCLQRYEKELTSDFSFTFTPYVTDDPVEDEAEVEVELATDELGLIFYKDDALELLQPLQDQLVMALPISPVCTDKCEGLCSECGGNLNTDKCGCEKKIFNSKFSALAGLKIESSNN